MSRHTEPLVITVPHRVYRGLQLPSLAMMQSNAIHSQPIEVTTERVFNTQPSMRRPDLERGERERSEKAHSAHSEKSEKSTTKNRWGCNGCIPALLMGVMALACVGVAACTCMLLLNFNDRVNYAARTSHELLFDNQTSINVPAFTNRIAAVGAIVDDSMSLMHAVSQMAANPSITISLNRAQSAG